MSYESWIDTLAEVRSGFAGWEPPSHDPADLARVALLLREIAGEYLAAAGVVEERLARYAPSEPILVDGVEVTVRRKARRTGWQSDDLLRAVLDSRLIDPATGEITEETPLDKVRAVWPLSGSSARVTALRARGIDPDEYSHSEWGTAVAFRR